MTYGAIVRIVGKGDLKRWQRPNIVQEPSHITKLPHRPHTGQHAAIAADCHCGSALRPASTGL